MTRQELDNMAKSPKAEKGTHPQVSIIVAAHQAEDTIERAVVGCLAQSHQSFEILLVDDGSTDSTWDLCIKLQTIDDRVRAYKQAWSGQGAARNRALKMASGEYIFILDSDDEILPSGLTDLLDVANAHASDVVIGDITQVSVRGSRSTVERLKTGAEVNLNHDRKGQILRKAHYTQGCLYRRDFLLGKGITFGEGYMYEDCEFLVGALVSTDRVTYLARSTYLRYERTGSTTSPTRKSFSHIVDLSKSFRSIRDKYGTAALDQSEALSSYMLSRVAHYTIIQGRVPARYWTASAAIFLKDVGDWLPKEFRAKMEIDWRLVLIVHRLNAYAGVGAFLIIASARKVGRFFVRALAM